MEIDINWLAILASVVASVILGAFWYSPLGFGKGWMREMGFTKKDLDKAKEKGMTKEYLLTMLGSLVMAWVLSHSVDIWSSQTIVTGIQVGFWTWLGFVATVLLKTVTWEGRSWKLYGINVTYWLVNLVVMGIILSVWQ